MVDGDLLARLRKLLAGLAGYPVLGLGGFVNCEPERQPIAAALLLEVPGRVIPEELDGFTVHCWANNLKSVG